MATAGVPLAAGPLSRFARDAPRCPQARCQVLRHGSGTAVAAADRRGARAASARARAPRGGATTARSAAASRARRTPRPRSRASRKPYQTAARAATNTPDDDSVQPRVLSAHDVQQLERDLARQEHQGDGRAHGRALACAAQAVNAGPITEVGLLGRKPPGKAEKITPTASPTRPSRRPRPGATTATPTCHQAAVSPTAHGRGDTRAGRSCPRPSSHYLRDGNRVASTRSRYGVRAGDRIRTDDLPLTRRLLYQLSYSGGASESR